MPRLAAARAKSSLKPSSNNSGKPSPKSSSNNSGKPSPKSSSKSSSKSSAKILAKDSAKDSTNDKVDEAIKAALDYAVDFLNQNKADDIVTINLKNRFPLADYMVIATGTSARHAVSLAQNLSDSLKQNHQVKTLSITGMATGEWLLLDLGDIIVHLFQKTTRDYYQLEKRWTDN